LAKDLDFTHHAGPEVAELAYQRKASATKASKAAAKKRSAEAKKRKKKS